MNGNGTELEARIKELERRLDSDRRPPRLGRRRWALVAAALAVALSVPTGVLSSHLFDDVPNANTFHGDIARIATAGITTGCDPNSYCPTETVTREQMAAFLSRTGGRIVQDEFSFPAVAADEAFASATIRTRGRAHLNVRASLYFLTYGTVGGTFPCENGVDIVVDGQSQIASRIWARTLANPATFELNPGSGESLIAVNGGTHTVELVWVDSTGSCDMRMGRGTLTAETLLFDSVGNNPSVVTVTDERRARANQ